MCKYPAAASFVVASAQVGDVSFVLLLVVRRWRRCFLLDVVVVVVWFLIVIVLVPNRFLVVDNP
jgi:hypothetical protein